MVFNFHIAVSSHTILVASLFPMFILLFLHWKLTRPYHNIKIMFLDFYASSKGHVLTVEEIRNLSCFFQESCRQPNWMTGKKSEDCKASELFLLSAYKVFLIIFEIAFLFWIEECAILASVIEVLRRQNWFVVDIEV